MTLPTEEVTKCHVRRRGSTVGARVSKKVCRDVAQLGSAPCSGRGGRKFESCHPDFFTIRERDILMKVHQISSTTNYIQPNFKANPSAQLKTLKSLTEKGKVVLEYIGQGCPKTAEGDKIYTKLYEHLDGISYFDPTVNSSLSVADAIKLCEDNLDAINRMFGKYGLELYGNLHDSFGKKGVTVTNRLKETGYVSDKLTWGECVRDYIGWNKKGKIDDVEERFGEMAPLYLDDLNYVSTDFDPLYENYVVTKPDVANVETNNIRMRAFRKVNNIE